MKEWLNLLPVPLPVQVLVATNTLVYPEGKLSFLKGAPCV